MMIQSNNEFHKLFFKQKMPKSLVKRMMVYLNQTESPYNRYNDIYNCIFVHIPKTGGISISKGLFNERSPGHVPIINYEIFDKIRFKRYFKFAFVRNPYDRLLSAYNYLKKGGRCEYDRNLRDKYLVNHEDFASFCVSLTDKNFSRKILSEIHFKPQFSYICDYQLNIQVDFVGKLENIDNDFKYVVNRLGIDKKLPHLNKTPKINYKSIYTEQMKEIVFKLYEIDIKLFKYSFDK